MASKKKKGVKMSLDEFLGGATYGADAILPEAPRAREDGDDYDSRDMGGSRFQDSRGDADDDWRGGGGAPARPAGGDRYGGDRYGDRAGGGPDDEGRWQRGPAGGNDDGFRGPPRRGGAMDMQPEPSERPAHMRLNLQRRSKAVEAPAPAPSAAAAPAAKERKKPERSGPKPDPFGGARPVPVPDPVLGAPSRETSRPSEGASGAASKPKANPFGAAKPVATRDPFSKDAEAAAAAGEERPAGVSGAASTAGSVDHDSDRGSERRADRGDRERGTGDRDRERSGGDRERSGGDRERSGGDRERSGGDRERSGGDRERSFGDRERSGGDRERSGGDRDRSFGDRDRGFGDRDRGFGDRDRGFGDRDRDRGGFGRSGFGDRERSGGDHDRGFGDRERSYGDRDRDRGGFGRSGFGDRERSGGDRERSYGDRERSYGDRERSYGDRERSGGDRERSYGDRERSGGDRERSYGDREDDRGAPARPAGRSLFDRMGGDSEREPLRAAAPPVVRNTRMAALLEGDSAPAAAELRPPVPRQSSRADALAAAPAAGSKAASDAAPAAGPAVSPRKALADKRLEARMAASRRVRELGLTGAEAKAEVDRIMEEFDKEHGIAAPPAAPAHGAAPPPGQPSAAAATAAASTAATASAAAAAAAKPGASPAATTAAAAAASEAGPAVYAGPHVRTKPEPDMGEQRLSDDAREGAMQAVQSHMDLGVMGETRAALRALPLDGHYAEVVECVLLALFERSEAAVGTAYSFLHSLAQERLLTPWAAAAGMHAAALALEDVKLDNPMAERWLADVVRRCLDARVTDGHTISVATRAAAGLPAPSASEEEAEAKAAAEAAGPKTPQAPAPPPAAAATGARSPFPHDPAADALLALLRQGLQGKDLSKQVKASELPAPSRMMRALLQWLEESAPLGNLAALLERDDQGVQLLPVIQPDRVGRLLTKVMYNADTEAQAAALADAQVFWASKGSPKGVLEALFISLYNADCLPDDAFFRWQRSDAYKELPGRRAALVETKSWLTWLEEEGGEEEEEEED